jgi:hypothetical protein
VVATNHGPRLSTAEYERRLVALYSGRPAMPSLDEQEFLRRQELEFAIDHRLGTGFPADRRDAMWAVAQRVEKHRLAFGLKRLVSGLAHRALPAGARGLVRRLRSEYAAVLSPDELEAFLGDPAG